jgi:hypothetical protein
MPHQSSPEEAPGSDCKPFPEYSGNLTRWALPFSSKGKEARYRTDFTYSVAGRQLNYDYPASGFCQGDRGPRRLTVFPRKYLEVSN